MNRHFTDEDMQMANGHRKKCSLVIRKMPVYREIPIHYAPPRMT